MTKKQRQDYKMHNQARKIVTMKSGLFHNSIQNGKYTKAVKSAFLKKGVTI